MTVFDRIKELSEKTNIPQSTISNWSQRKSISALKKATKEELDAIAERARKEGFDVTVSY